MGEQPYTLEVSSRGMSRPLTRPEHYRRNTGRLVTIVDATGRQTTGRITAADALAVTVEIAGESQTYPLDRIARAIVQVEFNRRLDDAEAGLDDQSFAQARRFPIRQLSCLTFGIAVDYTDRFESSAALRRKERDEQGIQPAARIPESDQRKFFPHAQILIER